MSGRSFDVSAGRVDRRSRHRGASGRGASRRRRFCLAAVLTLSAIRRRRSSRPNAARRRASSSSRRKAPHRRWRRSPRWRWPSKMASRRFEGICRIPTSIAPAIQYDSAPGLAARPTDVSKWISLAMRRSCEPRKYQHSTNPTQQSEVQSSSLSLAPSHEHNTAALLHSQRQSVQWHCIGRK
jgi:hypothetical protein